MAEQELEQSMVQKKIALAQSVHAPIIIELMKDCMENILLVDKKSEWNTIVNAITLDVQGTMLRTMADHLEGIRKGKLHNPENK